jgi:hypothetical protein
MTGLMSNLLASPDEWLMKGNNNTLTAWNFYVDSYTTEEENLAFLLPEVALSCLPEVNISLGQGGFAILTALTLVNAPQYPANEYIVDIMGPLTNTVYCEQIGQELMVLVTEIPTGNSCMSTIFVEDKLRPVLNCTADVLPCNVDIATIDFEDYLEPVIDNCDPDPDVWFSYVIQNLPCNANHYTQQILITWTATDNSGNSATCQDIIYLRQPALGEIVFPPDISISCVNANIDPSVTGEPLFDGEPIAGTCQFTVFHTDVVIPMCPGAQKILRTWTAMDWCTSGQVSDVQVILIVDDNAPVITCPPNITVNTNFGLCTATYILPNPPVTDACANANQIDVDIMVAGIPGIYSPGQVVNLGLGTTLITVRATDPCGNSSQCHYTVTVRDNTPPLIICPGNITVDCTASTSPSNTGSATAIDICDPSPDITYTDVTTASQSCALGYNITRTWKATDNSGNTAICMQMIVFTDISAPVISCPPNITIVCTASTAPANTGTATATDLCDATPSVTFTDAVAGGSCPQEHTISRTWRATDDCGNSSTCVQTIFVDDNVPPVITCPPNLTIECSDSTVPAVTGSATATDNCDPTPTLTFSDVNVPTGPQVFTINRTWIATDDCGNSSTCLQLILVHDDTPPVITCPANLTISCTASTVPPATGSATATDNCDADLTIDYSDVITGGACPQELTISRTWIATDDCGNSSTCIQIIFVDDSSAPVITCPANITVQCSASTAPANTGMATATDNCDTSPTVTFNDVTAGGACPQERTITRTWSAVDDCGNNSTCVQTIIVDDSVAPAITCPGNVTILCTASTAPGNTGTATATDNCDTTPTVTFTDATVAGGCPQERTINRTWVATDDCGNSSTCLQTIIVEDNLPPAISCPSNITIQCDQSTLPATTGTATATDNCAANPVVTFSDAIVDGACPSLQTITRTWTASDGCGNTSQCVQIIIVTDTTSPSIVCPANITVECTASTNPSNTGNATASDNCSPPPVVTFSDVTAGGACPQERTITRTFTATDGCGNTSTCTQTIFVDDSIAPAITCPANITIECNGDTTPGSTGTATSTDNCDASPLVTFSDVTSGGGCPQGFVITRTWVSTDDCGNSNTCIQMITGNDTGAPVISCPVNVTIQCTESTAPANTGSATATDNCDTTPTVTFSDATVAGACSQELTITRTWSATDDCGNATTCVQTIIVEDNAPPAITCPANVTIECTDGTLPPITGTATATDNCATNPTITFSDVVVSGVCPLLETITRTWTASDGCGNSSQCVQEIVVTDNTGPSITCPANITIECSESTATSNTGEATASDNCVGFPPEISFSDVTVAGTCPQESTITRTFTATDECGNTSACTQTIFIDDSTAPLITCPANITIECNDNSAPGNTGTATATDNCDGTPTVTFSDVTMGAGCPQGFTITRTWVATDDCGNSNSCVQIILVEDNAAPLISCPASLTIECTASSAPSNTGSATATDVCDATPVITFTDATVGGACPQEFTITRTWAATDGCGNIGTCNQTIIVDDSTAPICVANNITVSLTGSGTVTITGTQVGAGSSDACGPVTLSVAPNTFNCDNIGENLVVLTVTDCPGNTSTCTATVTINDDSGLEAICQNISIILDANGNASIDPEDIDNGSGGGCSGDSLTFDLSQTDFNCLNVGPNIVVLTVTDINGATATCTATVTVIDNMPPSITCPPNVTVDCHTVTNPDDTGQFGSATATDNCPGVIITETHVINLNECNVGTIIRTFTATDASGNPATCTQTVTISNPNPLDEGDITWPTSPVSVDICNSTAPENIPNGVPVIDPEALICANTTVTFSDAVQTIVDNNPATPCKIITRTWTITDSCQPSGTFVFVQTINVQDMVPPVFTNINDMTKVANNDCVAAFTIIASATDCAGVSITNNSPYGANTGSNASGNYPIGVTTVIFTATDGCGNISTMDVVITVTDPNPTIIQCEKAVIFLPQETEITLPADTFVLFIEGNCTTGDDFIISYSGTNPFDTLRTYDCGDVGVSTFPLWFWNGDGTMVLDSCQTADLDLRDPTDFCMDGLLLWGNIENEDGYPLSDIEVSITNTPMTPDTTDHSGQYQIEGLNENIGYRVAPFNDEDHREGVSTLDLVMIQKHLLGKAKLNSPYKMIAADANKSGHLTALDLLEIRKLILGINSKFPNNTSWRFVDRQYAFPDPYNPFEPGFPESVWIDSVTGGIDTVDFVAVKVGDVNGSYFLTRAGTGKVEPRSGNDFGIKIRRSADQKEGQEKWEIVGEPDQGYIDGFQFGLFVGNLPEDRVKQICSDVLTPDQWYYNPDTRTIMVSWSSGNPESLEGKVILSIPDLGSIMDNADISSTLMTGETYLVEDDEITIRKIRLGTDQVEGIVTSEYNLFQNIPNPFNESTVIRFSLPKEETVKLVISDVTGRQLSTHEIKCQAGINDFTIKNQELGTSGIYYYTLYTLNASFTRKMSFTGN